jgi:phage-related minor tail protein
VANEIKITVKKIDTGSLDKVSDAGKRAGKEAGAGLERGLKEGEQGAKKALDGVEQKLGKTADKAKQSGNQAGQGFADGLDGGLKSALSSGDVEGAVGDALGGLTGGGGVLAAAGAGIGAALIGGVAASFEQKQIGGLLAAQTGQTAQAAGELGHTAGQIFGDNFGASLDEVQAAMKAVFDNRLIDRGAAQDDIKAVTESAMTAAQVVGEDVGQIARAAQQLVRTGLAGSVTEAMDLITHASQQGLNASQDLIDTTTEYATKFRDLGISGQEAFGLIQQAVRAGARDTDTAADALKEFAIRAEDGSASTSRGFANVGLEARTMADMIAKGGGSAHQALLMTLEGFQRIENPVQRDQAAVDLFGTKAEDLGDALQHMDLKTASKDFGDFAGATDKAAKLIGDSTPPLETAWRNVGKGINNALSAVSGWGDESKTALAEATKAAEEAAKPQEEYKQRVQEAADAWRTQGGEIHHVLESLDEFIAKQHKIAGGVLDLSQAQIAYQKALDDTADAAKKNGKTLDLNTEKGRDNQSQLNSLVEATYDQIAAMEAQGASFQDLGGFMETARDQFMGLAERMGLSAAQAGALADQLHLIPGDYLARVNANTGQAEDAIRTLRGNLLNLTNRTYVASVSVTPNSLGGRMFVGLGHGGVVGRAAEGGPRGNQVLVGEQGPEIVDLAPGSQVHTAGDSMRMLAAAGSGSGPSRVDVYVHGDQDSMMIAWLLKQKRDGMLDFLVS